MSQNSAVTTILYGHMLIKTFFCSGHWVYWVWEHCLTKKKRDSNPNTRPTVPSPSQVTKHHTPMNTVMELKPLEKACKLTCVRAVGLPNSCLFCHTTISDVKNDLCSLFEIFKLDLFTRRVLLWINCPHPCFLACFLACYCCSLSVSRVGWNVIKNTVHTVSVHTHLHMVILLYVHKTHKMRKTIQRNSDPQHN